MKNEFTKINPSETAKITDPNIVPHINVGPCAKIMGARRGPALLGAYREAFKICGF